MTVKIADLEYVAVVGARGTCRYGVQMQYIDENIPRIYLLCDYPNYDRRLPSKWEGISINSVPKKYREQLQYMMTDLNQINEQDCDDLIPI